MLELQTKELMLHQRELKEARHICQTFTEARPKPSRRFWAGLVVPWTHLLGD